MINGRDGREDLWSADFQVEEFIDGILKASTKGCHSRSKRPDESTVLSDSEKR
jgi:hypothetical protein